MSPRLCACAEQESFLVSLSSGGSRVTSSLCLCGTVLSLFLRVAAASCHLCSCEGQWQHEVSVPAGNSSALLSLVLHGAVESCLVSVPAGVNRILLSLCLRGTAASLTFLFLQGAVVSPVSGEQRRPSFLCLWGAMPPPPSLCACREQQCPPVTIPV